MILLKRYGGVALMVVGALLLIVCHLAGWQTNKELLIALVLVVIGYLLHLRLQKLDERY